MDRKSNHVIAGKEKSPAFVFHFLKLLDCGGKFFVQSGSCMGGELCLTPYEKHSGHLWPCALLLF